MLQYPIILLNSFEHRSGFSEYKSGEDKLYILQRKLTTPLANSISRENEKWREISELSTFQIFLEHISVRILN